MSRRTRPREHAPESCPAAHMLRGELAAMRVRLHALVLRAEELRAVPEGEVRSALAGLDTEAKLARALLDRQVAGGEPTC